MRTSLVILALVAVAAVASVASAGTTFSFDPNDIVILPSTSSNDGNMATQLYATKLQVRDAGEHVVGSYGTYNGPAEYNVVNNWMNSLGAGEGIRELEIWIDPAFGYTSAYGVNLGFSPESGNAAHTSLQGMTASDGWTCTVGYYGNLPILDWSTNDPSKYIRPGGADLGRFTFTMDAALYNGSTYIGDVTPDTNYRFLFYAENEGAAPGAGEFIADDSGGTGINVSNPTGGNFWEYYNVGLVHSDAVPEPITMSLVGMGIFGLGGYIRRRVKVAK